MSNTGEYYNHTTYPAPNAAGASASLRAELDAIEQALNLLPALSGNGGKIAKVNAAGTAMDSSTVISEDGTDATIAGDLYVTGAQIGRSASKKLTLPDVNGDTFTLLAATQTLTNKTINFANNSLTMTLAQLNTAISDGSISGSSTTETLTNKTVNLANNSFTMTKAQLNAAVSDGTPLYSGDVGAVTAAEVSNTSVGNLAATNVQAALAELDSDLSAVITNNAKTDANNTYTKAQRGAVVALSDAATIAVDLALSNNFSLTIGGNRTLGDPSNLVAGQSGVIAVTQDGTGNRTLAYHATYKFAGGSAPVLSTAAGTVDYLNYYVEATGRVFITALLDIS